jgi:calcineurin-like phosphoesterase family protein
MKTWFTSDLHFGHPYVSSLRGFGTSREDADTEAHDVVITENWGNVVGYDDTVWVLGDIVGRYQDTEYALDIIKELPGTKHLIAGNHDAVSSIHKNAWEHQRQWLDTFESIQQYAQLRMQGQRVLLSHFPYLGTGSDHTADVRYTQYRLPDEGLILLHGHTHADEGTLQIHVGLDAWGLAPVEQKTIDKIIREHSTSDHGIVPGTHLLDRGWERVPEYLE